MTVSAYRVPRPLTLAGRTSRDWHVSQTTVGGYWKLSQSAHFWTSSSPRAAPSQKKALAASGIGTGLLMHVSCAGNQQADVYGKDHCTYYRKFVHGRGRRWIFLAERDTVTGTAKAAVSARPRRTPLEAGCSPRTHRSSLSMTT